MKICVRISEKTTLEDIYDFHDIRIIVENDVFLSSDISKCLYGFASIEEDGTAWVCQAAIKKLAKVNDRLEWEASFDAMVDSARRSGGVRDADQSILAVMEVMPAEGSVSPKSQVANRRWFMRSP